MATSGEKFLLAAARARFVEDREEAEAALAGAVAHLETVVGFCDEHGGDAIKSDVDLGEILAVLSGIEFRS